MQTAPGVQLDPNRAEAHPRPSAGFVVKHFVGSGALYGLILLLFYLNPWFRELVTVSFRGVTAFKVYLYLYVLYLGASLPLYLILRPASLLESKNLLVWRVLGRTAEAAWSGLLGIRVPLPPLTPAEKNALVFLLVKLLFGPLMLNSAFLELGWCDKIWGQYYSPALLAKLDFTYIFFVHLIFLVDSVFFFVGYHTEARFLRNNLRYVETNIWRILVCIMCYPPFNLVTLTVIGRSFYDPYILVSGDFRSPATWILRGLAVVFLLLLIASTISLFTRASNLTNRGIVTWGPYRYVRHPGYLAKNMFWLMTIIPALIPNPANVYFTWSTFWVSGFCSVCGFLAWGTIYYLRAITEEQFLSRDPDYTAYCKKVKYRFIPGFY